jgi:hypothetical protein
MAKTSKKEQEMKTSKLKADKKRLNEYLTQATLDFIKEAFCVDGKVELSFEPRVFSCTIKCTDKKRGLFFIGMDK